MVGSGAISHKIMRLQDVTELKQLFYRNFDMSRAHLMLTKEASQYGYVGGGRHFEVCRWRSANMDMAYKRASNAFVAELGSNLKHWLQMMKELQSLQLPLIPPFEIIHQDRYLAMVMPFGDAFFESCSIQWQPLAVLVEELQSELYKRKFAINDHIQGRALNGIPFVCDLSDVQRIS